LKIANDHAFPNCAHEVTAFLFFSMRVRLSEQRTDQITAKSDQMLALPLTTKYGARAGKPACNIGEGNEETDCRAFRGRPRARRGRARKCQLQNCSMELRRLQD